MHQLNLITYSMLLYLIIQLFAVSVCHFTNPTMHELTLSLPGHVVARVRMNRITTEAYQEAFQAVFSTLQDYQPSFKVGKLSLQLY